MYLRGGQTIKDTDMEQVVLFCRVSTQIQDYERQVSDLTLLAERHNWSIAETFTEKVSGAKKNEERKELTALLAYVRAHNINKVLVTELSRLGRDTLQVLTAIEKLNKAKVSLYIMNYNIETLTHDGKNKSHESVYDYYLGRSSPYGTQDNKGTYGKWLQ